MHREYLKENHPVQYNNLVLSCKLWKYLADMNKQVQQRMGTIIYHMQIAEGVNESLIVSNSVAWVQHMNSIRARAVKIVREKLNYV